MEAIKETAEEMFQQYLSLMEIDPKKTPPGTLTELRRTFYGALGMTFILIMDLGKDKNPYKLNKVLNRVKLDVWRFYKAQGVKIFE